MALASCLVEFLIFLGIPALRALKSLIQAAIVQLQIAKAEALSQIGFMDAAGIAAAAGINRAQLLVDGIRNTLSSLPTGTFKECQDVSTMIGIINDAFDDIFEFHDNAVNESNRIRTFQNIKSSLSSSIDEDIQYLQELSDQIDIVIIELLRREAIT